MSDCKNCGCEMISDGRGFAVCIPCLHKENNGRKARLRKTAQILIEEIGADGPENAEDVAERAVNIIRRQGLECEELLEQLRLVESGEVKGCDYKRCVIVESREGYRNRLYRAEDAIRKQQSKEDIEAVKTIQKPTPPSKWPGWSRMTKGPLVVEKQEPMTLGEIHEAARLFGMEFSPCAPKDPLSENVTKTRKMGLRVLAELARLKDVSEEYKEYMEERRKLAQKHQTPMADMRQVVLSEIIEWERFDEVIGDGTNAHYFANEMIIEFLEEHRHVFGTDKIYETFCMWWEKNKLTQQTTACEEVEGEDG